MFPLYLYPRASQLVVPVSGREESSSSSGNPYRPVPPIVSSLATASNASNSVAVPLSTKPPEQVCIFEFDDEDEFRQLPPVSNPSNNSPEGLGFRRVRRTFRQRN